MDTSFSNNVGNHGSPISDNARDKIKDGMQDSLQSVNNAGASLVDKVGSAVSQVTGTAKQGMDSVNEFVQKTRGSVSDSSEALISYTRENPIKALLIAAASGALLWTFLKAVAPSDE